MTETDSDVIGQAVRAEADDPCVFVARVDDRLVAFVHVHSTDDYYRRRRHGHVADLVVAEGFEGRGIAARLLDIAEDWARAQGFDWLSISVFEDNARAAQMYERKGFGRDVVRLIKPIANSTEASPVDRPR
ncbi:MAG: family N-acetyltransferase [Ilumatobacteraceae bacterium]|nr:family N-acetyltransferase [Ilumatobacteraceae bacterium]